MRLLLDTHVLLWLLGDRARLRPDTIELLAGDSCALMLSAASAWEIALKQSNGKLELPDVAEVLLPIALSESGITPLPIELADVLGVRALPFIHRDPFDRLIIAQARRHGLTLVTRDARIMRYDLDVMQV